MTIALYDLTVASFIQGLGGVAGVLEKGLAHCQATGADADAVLDARLIADMQPLRFQVQSVVHHSLGAIEGVKSGTFLPPGPWAATRYAELQDLVAEARASLSGLSRDEVDALEGRDVAFQVGERRIPYVGENFLMSFSIPNFYFHATTAYDILRARGVPLGKKDYIGTPRLKA